MRVDVAIIGAGTAGAAAAWHAAARGMSVACLDRRPLDGAGARWIDGVPGWMFDEAGLARPAGDELAGDGHAFHLFAGRGPRRLVVRDHGVLDVDVRRLVGRLHDLAREAGATLRGDVHVRGFDGAALHTSAGPVHATWFVDASGLSGARLLGQPPVARGDLCAAAQEVRAVRDPGGARAFFDAHGVPPGDTLSFSGVAGGFSVVNARLVGDRVSLLTGSIPSGGHPSGRSLLDAFVAEQPWIGGAIFGGARAIPLGRPLRRLAEGRIALLGDAACQVFSAHGSGVGIGLVAARLLAEELASGGGAAAYAQRFQRRWGGLLASADQLRRLAQSLDPPTLERLFASGLIDERSTRDTLAQRLPSIARAGAAARLANALREPRLIARVAPFLARAAAAPLLYARHPSGASAASAWAATVDRVLGDVAPA